MAKKLRDEDLVLNIIVNGDKGKKEIGELERAIRDTNSQLNRLEKQKKELEKTGNRETAQYKALLVEIEKNNNALNIASGRLSQLKQGLDMNKMSMSDLRSEMVRISKLRNIATPGTENWKLHNNQLTLVNQRYQELRKQAGITGNSIQGMTSSITRNLGMITGGAFSLFAMVSGVRNATDKFGEFDDKVADVQKTTGLLKEEVLEINESLKSLDTRTSQEELLGLGRVAGKLGIDIKEDVEGFIRAADQIGVALSEDLGGDVEGAINAVGKLVDIFNIKGEFGIEQALLKTGSAINELGAASTANEAFLVDFTKRLGGVAPAAKISIADILGLGATLDQFGQSVEVSGTSMSQLIVNMFDDTAKFAKIAGQDVGDFTKLLNTDANEALVQLLEGVKGNDDAFSELVSRLKELGIDGARATQVVSVLASNTETLREQQLLANKSFEEGTSLTDEFNIKNETAAAKLAKVKREINNLWVELGQNLMPAMTLGNSLFATFLQLLLGVIKFVSNNSKLIITLAAGYVTYNAALFISNLSLAENIVLTKAKIFWDKAQHAGLLLVAIAQALYYRNITRATAGMRAFNAVSKLNPWILLASVIVAAGVAIYQFSKGLSAAEKAQKSLNETQLEAAQSTIKERLEVERLLAIATDAKQSYEDRKAAIEELNRISPKYLGHLDMANILTGEGTKATEKYIEALTKKAKMEAAYNKVAEIESKRMALLMNGEGAELTTGQQAKLAVLNFGNTHKQVSEIRDQYRAENLKKAGEALDAERDLLEKFINDTKGITESAVVAPKGSVAGSGGEDPQVTNLKSLNEELRKLQEERETLNINDVESLKKNEAQIRALQEKISAFQIKSLSDRNKAVKEDRSKEEIEREKELEKQAEFRQKILEGQLAEKDQAKLALDNRLKEAGIFGKQRELMTQQELQVLIALEEDYFSQLDQINGKAIQESLSKRQNQYEHEKRALVIQHNEEFKQIETMEQARAFLRGKISDEAVNGLRNMREAQKAIDKIFLQDEEKITEQYLKGLKEDLEEFLSTGNMEGIDLGNELLSDEDKEKLKERIEEVKLLLSELGIGSSTADETNKGEMRSLTSNVDIFGFTSEDWLKLEENLKAGKLGVDGIVMAATGLTNIWASYNKAVSDGERAKLIEFEQNHNKQADLLRKQLDAGIINQDSYNQRIGEMNGDLDRKKAVFARNEAKREREVSIMTALVSTFAAAASALKAGPIAGPILAAIIAGLGLKQVDNIRKTPLPEIPGAQSGGYLEDVTRSQDGKMFRAKRDPKKRGYVDRPTVIVGESGTEMVANDKAVQNPTVKPVLDIIDTAQRNGQISSLNLMKVLENNQMLKSGISGRQSGGSLSESSGGSTSDFGYGIRNSTDFTSLISENVKIQKLLLERLKKPIKSDVSLIGRGSLEEKQEELSLIQKSANL